MKKHVVAAAILAVGLGVTMAQAQQAGGSLSGPFSAAQSLNYNNFQSSRRPASSAIAPGLFSSGLSCSGSVSAGGAGGGWGISLGITREDAQCNARENAKSVLGLTGDRIAAKEVLCDIPTVRAAFARANHPCIGRGGDRRLANGGNNGSRR